MSRLNATTKPASVNESPHDFFLGLNGGIYRASPTSLRLNLSVFGTETLSWQIYNKFGWPDLSWEGTSHILIRLFTVIELLHIASVHHRVRSVHSRH